MMLARADGKCRAEYLLEQDKETIRRLSRGAILEPPRRVDELIELVDSFLERRDRRGSVIG